MIAAQGNSSEILRILLEHEAYVNSTDIMGWTPLHFAVKQGETKFVQLLLQYHANPNSKALFNQDKESELEFSLITLKKLRKN